MLERRAASGGENLKKKSVAHKYINTRNLTKSNVHWRFFQWVTNFEKKTKVLVLEKGHWWNKMTVGISHSPR